MTIITISAMLTMTAACAQPPESIASVPSQERFAQVSCHRLGLLKTQKQAELLALEDKQRAAVVADAAGVALFFIPLGSLAGGDEASAIAVLKGQIEAINNQLLNC